MIPLARVAQPAAIAVLRQATALYPKRLKASDGLLPSRAHVKQNPNSDHNSGFACDLSHDPKNGIDCKVAYKKYRKTHVLSILFLKDVSGQKAKGDRDFTGYSHPVHLHISINETMGKDTSPWFPWLGKAKKLNKIKAKLKRNPKKKESK
jgi:hypothetical protein